MGRPSKKANIDKVQFEKLCALQCTELEICNWFDVNTDTLNTWCKDTYNITFSDVFRQKRTTGWTSLRRSQFKQAENNPTMAIWLGKQYLGQKDNPDGDTASEMLQTMLKSIQDMVAMSSKPSPNRNIEDLE